MRNYYSSKLAILVYLLLLPILGWGQGAGDLDTSFRTGTGPYGNITATKILPNGKILITGNFTNYQGVSRNGIARLNADGSIDTSFNPGTGLSGGSDGFIGNSLALQSDGKIIVAGQFSSCNGFGVQNIARIHTDGRVDTTFYLNFYRSEPVTAMAIQNDDKIIIGGRNGYHYNIVKRLNPNGRLDTTFHIGYVNYFGSGDLSSAYSIAIQSDGKIIVGGYFNYYDYQNARSIIRLNINGTVDTNFQRDVPLSYVSTLAIQEDGKILIGTSPSSWYNNGNTININRLTRLNNNGSLDMLFNPTLGGCLGGSNSAHRINAIAIQPNGNILVGGYFDCYNNNIPRNGIARIKNDGNLDTVLVSYPNNSSWINALSIQPDEKIIVSGTFTTFNGFSTPGIVRIHNSLCATPTTPTISGATTFCAGSSTVLTSSTPNRNLWSTGDTTRSITVNTAGSYSVRVISLTCTSARSSIVSVTITSIPTIPTISGANTFCTGRTTVLTSSALTGNLWSTGATTRSITVNTERSYTVRTISGNCTSAASNPIEVTQIPLPSTPTISGTNTFCAGGSTVLTSSALTGNLWSNGATTRSITVTTARSLTVRAISGTCTSANSPSVTVSVTPLPSIPTISGSNRFCTGSFTVLTSSSATGNLWSTGDTTRSISVSIAGNYSVQRITGVCTSLASNAITVSAISLPPTPTISGINSFSAGGYTVLTSSSATGNLWSNGAISQSITVSTAGSYSVRVISGTCTSASSNSVTVNALLPPIGYRQQAGSIDSSFRTRLESYGVNTAIVQPDGKIIIGGGFLAFNGTRNYIARLNADGSFDSTFNSGTGPNGGVMAAALQPDGKIVIGGDFNTYNGIARNRIARLNADGSLDTTFNQAPIPNQKVLAIAVQTDGKIVIGGLFNNLNPSAWTCLARLNSNGSLDDTFIHTAGPDHFVSSIAIQADGKIIVGGNSITYGRIASIVRLNSNGSNDDNFITYRPSHSRTYSGGAVYSLALQPDGKIVLGGSFRPHPYTLPNPDNGVVRLNTDGSLDSNFTLVPGNLMVLSVSLQSNGKIVFGGNFLAQNGRSSNGIGRLNYDGSIDSSFNTGSGGFDVLVTTSQPDGKIIVGGTFSYFNDVLSPGIVRIFGCTTPPTPTISGTNTICPGGSTILTSSSAIGNIWSTGDTTQSITVNTSGSYTVWRVSGDCTSGASSPTVVSTIICNQIFTGDGLFTNTDRWLGGSIPNTGTDITVRGIMTLTSSVSLRNVNIENGGIVVPSGLTLTVTGNLSNQGVISGGGAVRLTGANNQEFGGGTISNLVVDNSATVIQNAATQISGSITLGNNQVLDLNNLSFTLLSTATHTAQLAQVPANSSITNGANFTVQRWLNRSFLRRGALANGNYYFLGPVVQGQTMNLWNSVSRYNNQTFSGSGVGNLYLYNPTSNNWYKPSSASTSLPVGAGVQVWFGSTTFFSVRNEWSASGAPQIGDYNLPITPNQGFQLLSNPYPSTIDWDSPNWTKTNVSNAIYIYDWVNRRYKSYIDGLGANGGSRYLPTAQGFIVRAESNSPVLTAREGIKVSNQVALQRTENQASSVIRLQTRRGSMTDEVVIAHRPNSQLAFEPQVDARKMMNPATNIFIAGTVRQSIASMDLNAATVIPIELLSDSTGMVTLSTTEFSGLSGGPYYLVDEITTEVYPYTPQTSYQFYLNANEPYSLSLRLNNVNGISDFKANVFEVYPNPATDKVTIKTVGTGTLEILNTLGQAVITQPATATKEINVSKLAKGIYTVRFNGASQKLVVR